MFDKVLKTTEVKLELLKDIDMSLMAEKSIRGGICHTIYWSLNANNKYTKDYDKNKCHILFIGT